MSDNNQETLDDIKQQRQFEADIRKLESLGLIAQVPGTDQWIITPAGSAAIAPCEDQPEEHDYVLTAKGRATASRLIDNK